ncbi:purine catabolism regulator [Solirubrobacter pauli]|uniref:Purine catabolism regulator n=1 Tax=Solirubrobacter pauli TaxID=166793 RepID=A0A660L564_9ACTN|nr:PucR family transcriptional regulator [Solirubrobacter pauli]RKQ86710.1 purine catabolism regulator [Solirubrobacter pauli]
MLVLADLLAAEELGLTLVAGGADALAREVAGAHSIDVELPTRFLERRWLMLTAGMRLRGSAAAQRALIAELDEAGISALGIGLGLVFQRPPRALVEEARARSFPVLAVPLETAFRDITGFVARSSLSGDLHRYQRLTAIQRHLVDALREPDPRTAMVQRLARMLDAGVLVLDGPSAGAVPDAEAIRRRVAEREFEDAGWHVVTVPIAEAGWLAVTARRRVPLARAAAQAAVPLLAATERLAELARDQERAVRAALLDELLELTPGGETRGLASRAASFGVTFPARVVVSDAPIPGLLVTRRRDRWVALTHGELGGRPVHDVAGVPRSYRDAVLAHERGLASFEAFDLPALLLAEVDPELVRPRVDALLDPLPEAVLTALVEYFARDQDVNAAAAALHVHPNTLRYRLGRVEALLGRSLKAPATIAELTLALSTRAA